MSASVDGASSSASMSTTRTAMRQSKLVVAAPSTVPRLTGSEPLLETMQGSAELLEQLKPSFTTQMHLQAIGLSGRQLPLLTKDEQIMPHLFNAAGIRYVQPHPNGDPSQRILLLNVSSTSPTPDIVLTAIQKHSMELLQDFALELTYDNLTSDQILESLLPESIVTTEGVPSGFTIVGHIAHLNLLDIYLPYRYLVGHIILSKHGSTLRTVVNKLDSIDTEFRFFKMELLSGEPDYIAKVSESDCSFEFDFRSVYWNSRLHAEHMRLIKKCRPNQVLSDVMAGVGPFAVPAAKRGTWVLANDLNPSSHESLVKNAKINKVLMLGEEQDGKDRFDGGLIGRCMDGREFIRWSMVETWRRSFKGRPKGYDGEEWEKEDEKLRDFGRKIVKDRTKKIRQIHAARQAFKSNRALASEEVVEATSRLSIDREVIDTDEAMEKPSRWEGRKMVDRFVMNLPASALEFLDAFSGAYTYLASIVGEASLRTEISRRIASVDSSLTPYPIVHVHCFSKNPFNPTLDILNRANHFLGIPPTSPHRLKAKPIPPPPQTFSGLRKSSSSPPTVASYLTSHPDYHIYKSFPTQPEFMNKLLQDWQTNDNGQHTKDLEIHYVRDVAPNKQMYCLSFPIPKEVLWAPIS
ncbi:related to met-10 protein [Ustilago trichophora]|uniref:tRNA (guanine(37)-N1)-methyltransferase n=1 Tax=Ustilago trichophora TaxID=86804 RepID=A0A5C3DS17_9BASI|nr:related to met-10 protein [Ustilago trichophora]